jgi:uncharacterized protein YggE
MPNSSSLQTDTVLRWVGVVVLAVLGLFLVAKTVNTFAERDYIGKAVRDRDLITVSGMGSVTAKPDLAKVDVGVFSEGQSVSAVQGDSTSKMNAMIDALKTLGITDADIQTSNYNLQPKIDWSDNKQRVIGYTLTQTVNVKVRDLAKVGDVLESATSHGANQIYGVQFTIDDPTSIQDEARVKAIKEAQKKADALADAVEQGIAANRLFLFRTIHKEKPTKVNGQERRIIPKGRRRPPSPHGSTGQSGKSLSCGARPA